MLRRSDKDVEFDDDRDVSEGRDMSAGSKDNSDFSGWRISKKKVPGIVDAAAEVAEWMRRAELGRDPEMDLVAEGIINEFREVTGDYDGPTEELTGGAAGLPTKDATESWFVTKRPTDKDPYKIIERAEKFIEEAQALNMTYLDYVEQYVKKPVFPTVERIKPTARRLEDDVSQLVTTPHSYPVYTLMPRVPYTCCWYGLYFEIEAREQDVEIQRIYTQTGIYHEEKRDTCDVWVYTCDEGAGGYELDEEKWRIIGHEQDVRMVKVNFTLNSNPEYGRLPLDEPLVVKKGQRRGMLVFTNEPRGIVIRGKAQGSWLTGDVSDADDHLIVRAGMMPVTEDELSSDLFKTLYDPVNGGAFCGVIDYKLL